MKAYSVYIIVESEPTNKSYMIIHNIYDTSYHIWGDRILIHVREVLVTMRAK